MNENRSKQTAVQPHFQPVARVAAVTRTCADRVTGGACQICDANELGTWHWDLRTDDFHGSDQTRHILGLSDAEPREIFLGRIEPEDRAVLTDLFESLAWKPEPFDVQFTLKIAGDTRTIRMQGYPDFEAGDHDPRLFGTVEDITARLQASDALLELSLAVEQSRDYVCITDANGTIEYVNPAWRDRFAPERSLTGMPVAMLLGDPQIYIDGRIEVERVGMFRRTLKKTNGATHFEEITMWPVRDIRGNVVRIVVISSDVTNQKQAEESAARLHAVLRSASNEWRQTVDAVDAAVVLFEPPAKIRRMNLSARDLLGRREYDLVGCDIRDTDLPAPWPAVLEAVQEAADRGLSCSRQTYDAESGRTWDIIANVSLSEEVHDVVAVIREVTATLAMQESLRRSEVMSAMGSLVAGVAHEVKNPLFGMTATLDAMELKFRASADSMRYTGMIRRELDRLQLLMHDLLDYGRASNLDLQPTLLGSAIASAVNLCRDAAAERQVNIVNFVPLTFGACRADGLRLEQVFRNLVDNALCYSSAGQQVTILARETLRAGKPWFEIEVHDAGPGFAEGDLPFVFEPFFTRRKGGTGLGLSIVRRMIEAHGGNVTAKNSGGRGATLRVELPAGRE